MVILRDFPIKMHSLRWFCPMTPDFSRHFQLFSGEAQRRSRGSWFEGWSGELWSCFQGAPRVEFGRLLAVMDWVSAWNLRHGILSKSCGKKAPSLKIFPFSLNHECVTFFLGSFYG